MKIASVEGGAYESTATSHTLLINANIHNKKSNMLNINILTNFDLSTLNKNKIKWDIDPYTLKPFQIKIEIIRKQKMA